MITVAIRIHHEVLLVLTVRRVELCRAVDLRFHFVQLVFSYSALIQLLLHLL